MCSPKRYNPDSFFSAHCRDHKNNVTAVVHTHVHMPHLMIFHKRCANGIGCRCTNWQEHAFKQVDCAFKRVTVLPAIYFFLVWIVINLRPSEDQPEFIFGNAKLVWAAHSSKKGSEAAAQPSAVNE